MRANKSICTASFIFFLLLWPAVSSGKDSEYTPLSLWEAVESALEANLDLRIVLEDSEIAAGEAELTEGEFDMVFIFKAGAERREGMLSTGLPERESRQALRVGVAKQFTTGTELALQWNNDRYDGDDEELSLNPWYNSEMSLEVTQPLLRGWGKEAQTAEVRAARQSHAEAVFQVKGFAAELAVQVTQVYWDFVFTWREMEVKQLSLELARKLLTETEAKIAAGTLSMIEVFQPQSEVALREEELISAARSKGIVEDELKLLMNSAHWQEELRPVDEPPTVPVRVEADSVYKEAVENRPDLQAAARGVEAARLRKLLAEDNLRPSLDLDGLLGYGGTDGGYSGALDRLRDDPGVQWQLGLTFSMPLNNSSANGSFRRARAEYNKARVSAELLKLTIKKEVRTTVRDVELAIKAMDATRKTSLAMKKRMEAEQVKFSAGHSTTLDVLTAQEAYSRALSQENKTYTAYAKTLAELERIKGSVTLAANSSSPSAGLHRRGGLYGR